MPSEPSHSLPTLIAVSRVILLYCVLSISLLQIVDSLNTIGAGISHERLDRVILIGFYNQVGETSHLIGVVGLLVKLKPSSQHFLKHLGSTGHAEPSP